VLYASSWIKGVGKSGLISTQSILGIGPQD